MVNGQNSLVLYLALYERSQQDKDRDTGPDNEVNEVPEGQAAHLSQSHLFHLQAQPVPLVSQRALKANQHHLQSCRAREEGKRMSGRNERSYKMLSTSHSYPDKQPGWWTLLIPPCAGPSPCRPGWSSELGKRPA